MFHFIFVPLTLGLTWMLVMLEACFLITGKEVYRDMVKFWAKLLAINFAIGVITGITMEFEFGLNWAYFSRVIGGSFGPVLAIEGITAFMLEATMFGLFFFTWDKVGKGTHFIITILMAFGASLSIVNILAANSWMQHPVASVFNYADMSVDLESIAALYLNTLAQVRIGHVAFAGFLTSSMFMLGISAFYLLKKQDINFAKRSFSAAAGFGLVCVLCVAFFGDQNGLAVSKYEPEKMAAIEAQWTTQKAPAAWYVIAFPDQKLEKNFFTLQIPYALSLIATHSLTGTVEGVKEIQQGYIQKIKDGQKAYDALMKIRQGDATDATKAEFNKYRDNIGFGFMLEKFTDNVAKATPEDIKKVTKYAIPNFAVAFWTFRIMLACWGIMFLLLIFAVYFSYKNTLENHRGFLRLCLYSIPLPWIAVEAGWLLAEVGRQPWIVHYFMPTFLGPSSVSIADLITSIILFIIFYACLLSVELFLMFKFARRGPSALHLGRYHYENNLEK
jgi:cytochrome d ubiquinol oxidase subunit I